MARKCRIKRCVSYSDLVVCVDLQQMWQNSLHILLYEFFYLYIHGEEQNRPEAAASFN